MKEIKQLKEKGKPDAVKDRTDGLVAAMRIQKVWRGFTTRRKTRHGKVEEMFLIGMIPKLERQNEVLLENDRKVSASCSYSFLPPVRHLVSFFFSDVKDDMEPKRRTEKAMRMRLTKLKMRFWTSIQRHWANRSLMRFGTGSRSIKVGLENSPNFPLKKMVARGSYLVDKVFLIDIRKLHFSSKFVFLYINYCQMWLWY